ncbi:patatin-like phospholipase family protein [Roseateles sp. DAIF2]|uniref:patatin-like phospholipase family protein n=1 Tax=Roseateles sp. DAIF2 TaxID=2714952 RepID=UPI001BC93E55|nr:patatin-like phospholipase family protein [Roseateles sp. DAIF2]
MSSSSSDGDGDAIQDLVRERRAALYGDHAPPEGEGLWGLALSGGGIRSATFCFGLIKALAREGALLRFDLLSTVSGGGYIGAAVGKLFHQARSPAEVVQTAEALASADKRWLAWWLRANGRYLIPRGLADALFAASLYLRNLLAIHLEIGILGLLLGAVLALFNIHLWPCVQAWLPGSEPERSLALRLLVWLPSSWLLLAPQSAVALLLACAYWMVREPGRRAAWSRLVLAATPALWAGVAALLWWLRPRAVAGVAADADFWPPALWWVWALAFGAALAWVLAPLYAALLARWLLRAARRQGETPPGPRELAEACRQRLTGQLAGLGQLALVLLLLGLLDRLAWFLAFELGKPGWYGTALVALSGLLRLLLPRLVPSSSTLAPAWGLSLATLGHLAGLLLLFLLGTWWVSLAYALVLQPDVAALIAPGSSRRALLLLMACLGFALLTAWNIDFLNLSSLHQFYRARLVRSYLGAANGQRFTPAREGSDDPRLRPLEVPPQEPDGGWRVASVDAMHRGDDLPQRRYAPHANGGPVHLINCCINQTHDPRGGLFNQDRRGLPFTIGPRGVARVGLRPWRKLGGLRAMSLGSWMAISGAAFAPGLGGMTRTGVAVLAMTAGLRLGHWWDSRGLKDARRERDKRRTPWAPKSRMVLDELRGRFDAERMRHWYLSDGGHYENTGAYALLAEQCGLIVLADCGADPRYGFGDLENLVRKARIDLQTEIEFLRPARRHGEAADGRLSAPSAFGSLNDLASAQSISSLALARIQYRRSGARGLLVVVKPNICPGLPVDLINFKRENPLFPQQSTTDQFFDEAQWESYFTLGEELGANLGDGLLHRLPELADRAFVVDDGVSMGRREGDALPGRGEPAAAGKAAAAASSRMPARLGAGRAVAATVGLSAATTLGISLWQTIDALRTQGSEAQREERQALRELGEQFGRLQGGTADGGKELAALAGQLLRVADTQCRGAGAGGNASQAGWFRGSTLAQCVLQQTLALCLPRRGELPACALLLESPAQRCLDMGWQRRQQQPRLLYWGLDLNPPAPSCPPAALLALGPAGTPAASAMPAPPAGTDARQACQAHSFYLQIHGPAQRAAAERLRERWQGQGLRVAPVEDLLAASARSGEPPPRPYARTTLLLPPDDPAAQACVRALRPPSDWDLLRPAGGLQGTPGVIEVWWAR